MIIKLVTLNAILKRKIISKFRPSLTKILSLISPSTKNFTLNLIPFLYYSLPTAAFLPFRYTSFFYVPLFEVVLRRE